jgi:hypothetical protein
MSPGVENMSENAECSNKVTSGPVAGGPTTPEGLVVMGGATGEGCCPAEQSFI